MVSTLHVAARVNTDWLHYDLISERPARLIAVNSDLVRLKFKVKLLETECVTVTRTQGSPSDAAKFKKIAVMNPLYCVDQYGSCTSHIYPMNAGVEDAVISCIFSASAIHLAR